MFLAGPVSASAAVAAGGVVTYSTAMAIARFGGDALTVRWGVGGTRAAQRNAVGRAGCSLALATRVASAGALGFALVGAGCAAIVPALFRLAATAPGSRPVRASRPSRRWLPRRRHQRPGDRLPRARRRADEALGLVVVGSLLIAILGPRLEQRLRLSPVAGEIRKRRRRRARRDGRRASRSSASRPASTPSGARCTAELGEKARDRIAHFLTRKVEKGQLEQDARDAAVARLSLTTELADLADCDLVIEAIVEELAPKQELFAELERICRPDAVLATNTSALSVTEIACGDVDAGARRRHALLQPGAADAARRDRPGRASSDDAVRDRVRIRRDGSASIRSAATTRRASSSTGC